ncbi:MAG: response regulator [Candidatus Cloacimonas sp.]|jgi:PAS domain S-box-containing protein|nr:response regulator [Candidatus Cloacimonadota bacterium]
MNAVLAEIKNTKKIIIVEDNENVGKMIAKTLTNEGYNTKVIAYGSAAVFYALENTDSILLMEYKLPDMTAKEIINTIRDNNQDIPFIIMSPPGDEKVIIEMMKLGAKDYLVKEQGFLDLLPSSVERVVYQINMEDRLTKTERSLRNTEAKFQKIFNCITDPIFIYTTEGSILETNGAVNKVLGYMDKDLQNTSFFDIHPENFRTTLEEYLKEMNDDEQIVYETIIFDRQGDEVPTECTSRMIDFEDSVAILTIIRPLNGKHKNGK